MTEDSGEPKLLGDGRYRVRGLLGQGSQADTLWAEDTRSGAQVAIKRFQVRGAKSWKDVELAEREVSVLSRLSHRNLPKYLTHFHEDGALFLVMEKIEGQTLAELRARGALDQATVKRFLADLADTLSELHGMSPPLVHRDIKPQNVIMRPDGGFSLVDFGSVRDKLRPEGGSTVVGTFGYMAPEQFQGRAGPATDVYGAGATAIACLSGLDPEALPHRGLAIDVRAALGGQVDAKWVDLLSRLLEPDPDKRANSLKEALAATLDAKPRSTPPRNEAPRPDPREFWKELPELTRKQLRRAQKQQRREAKQMRRATRRAARLERFGGVGGRATHWHGWFWVLLAVGITLFAVRLIALGVLRIGLPILLSVLAVMFGAGMRRAARRSAEAGRRVDDALERAIGHVRGVPPPERDEQRPRVRVDDAEVADEDAEAEAQQRETHDNSRASR